MAGLDEDDADISAGVTADYVAAGVTTVGDCDPDGLLAVTAMLSYLAEDFTGTTPNPAKVSAHALADALGPRWHDWCPTGPCASATSPSP